MATLAASGCYRGPGPGGAGGEDTGETTGDSEGSEGSSGEDTGEDDASLGCGDGEFDPGPTVLRRMTPGEYVRSVQLLTGVDPQPYALTIPADGEVDGFETNAVNQAVSTLHVGAYQTVAEKVSADVMADPSLRTELVGCDPANGAACIEQFAADFGRLAYRRPLTDAEVVELVALAQTVADDPDAWAGIGLVLEALLQSPKFILRAEVGVNVDGEPTLRKLTPYELATRLSFSVLGRTPDRSLLDAAEAGELDDREGIRARAEQLLDDEAARDAMVDFGEQWFRLASLDAAEFDPVLYPDFTPELAQSARKEFRKLMADAMWSGGSLIEAYAASRGYVDDRLAALYGVEGTGFEPVEFPAAAERGGILTSAAVLMSTSSYSNTSVVQRGLYVREVALCDPPAPPPDNVDTSSSAGQSQQDAADARLSDAFCGACHAMLDRIGLGLERYDAIGALRETDDNGDPIAGEGEIVGMQDGEFVGGVELGALVAGTDDAPRCATRKLFRYSFGRAEEEADDCTLDLLDAAFADAGHDFRELVLELVTSDAFRYRRAE